MNKIWAVFAMAMFMLPMAFAQEPTLEQLQEKAGFTPDHPLYGLDLFLDKYMNSAEERYQERLAEAEVMQLQAKTAEMNQALSYAVTEQNQIQNQEMLQEGIQTMTRMKARTSGETANMFQNMIQSTTQTQLQLNQSNKACNGACMA
jgi:hypothetical protein